MENQNISDEVIAKAQGKTNMTVLKRTDFTPEALNLGVWDCLTEGMPEDTRVIEVFGVVRVA